MKYVNAKAVLLYHLVEEPAENTYRPDIYLYPGHRRTFGTGPGVSKAAAAGAGGAGRRNRGCLPAGVSLEELGDKYCLSVHAIRKIQLYQK
ncbi:MAG: hypothetical protein ACLTW9_30595 [Enterocloster sp.]